MEKINHRKIAIKTLLIVLFAFVVIILINSWPNIKQAYNGNSPPLNSWINYSFKQSNLVLLAIYGVYFYYRNYSIQKKRIQNHKVVEVQNKIWDEPQ